MAFDLEERWLLEAEQSLGMTLPAAYRSAIMKSNGGEIEVADDDVWSLFSIRDQSDRRRLARSGIGLVAEQTAARQWRGFPTNAIAIGTDGSGNMLAFLTEDSVCLDEVWVWEHETGELTSVAASFDELSKE